MFRTNVRHRVLFTIDCRESLVARSCRENFYRVVTLVIIYCIYIQLRDLSLCPPQEDLEDFFKNKIYVSFIC